MMLSAFDPTTFSQVDETENLESFRNDLVHDGQEDERAEFAALLGSLPQPMAYVTDAPDLESARYESALEIPTQKNALPETRSDNAAQTFARVEEVSQVLPEAHASLPGSGKKETAFETRVLRSVDLRQEGVPAKIEAIAASIASTAQTSDTSHSSQAQVQSPLKNFLPEITKDILTERPYELRQDQPTRRTLAQVTPGSLLVEPQQLLAEGASFHEKAQATEVLQPRPLLQSIQSPALQPRTIDQNFTQDQTFTAVTQVEQRDILASMQPEVLVAEAPRVHIPSVPFFILPGEKIETPEVALTEVTSIAEEPQAIHSFLEEEPAEDPVQFRLPRIKSLMKKPLQREMQVPSQVSLPREVPRLDTAPRTHFLATPGESESLERHALDEVEGFSMTKLEKPEAMTLDTRAAALMESKSLESLHPSNLKNSVQPMTVSTPEELKEAVLSFVAQPSRTESMHIRLNPDHLGEVVVQVTSKGQEVSVEIQTATEEAKTIVEEGVGLLREALSAKSLVLTHTDIRTTPLMAQSGAEGQQSAFSEQGKKNKPDFEAWTEVVHQARDRAYVNGLRGRGAWNGFQQQLDLRV